MTGILLISQFILTAVLTIAVLLQKSSSIGLGAYSGSNESLFGAKGPAGFMAKFTFVMGLVFVANTLTLGYYYNQEQNASIAEEIKIEKNAVPLAGEPLEVPSAPKTD
ncbi:MAG: preprotein translocase subunit SecG [Sulfurospirillum sp.]|nr:preprotein translocase subunit SecG [Sulfurospirillum sp.]MBL0703600.1 preprotein translocase subunit SecG [Sulfurospirillum sp.]